MQKPIVAAVILAAGGSVRFGAPKPLLDWGGRPLVAHMADTAWAAGLDPVVVVLGAAAERVAPALAGRPVQVLRNYRWASGMSSSLSVGLAALPESVAAVICMPVDQPLITPGLLRALVARWQETGAAIVAPRAADGVRGAPALFAREVFADLAGLAGDVGGRALFAAHADRLAELPVAEAYPLTDADTPDVYAALQAHGQTFSAPLAPIRAVLSDMDGVLWRGDTPLPGFHAFFAFLQERALDYILVTNNSGRTPEQYVDKLARLGVRCEPRHILTSAQATADYLAERAAPGAPVYVIGSAALAAALQARGFQITDGTAARYVVMGWDRDLSWEKLATATRLIRQGAEFIATNPDRTFPMEQGLVPGNGAQVAALQAATDVTPVMVGKPAPILYQQALARMQANSATTLVIGDRLDTDILGAVILGMPTALLLSGITTPDDLRTSPIHPDWVCADLEALVALWRRA